MIIQSMTGYGKGATDSFKVEVRSTNQRNLEIKMNVPSCMYPYEQEIRNMVKEKFSRGRIEISISRPDAENVKLKINKSLASEFYSALVSLKDELSIPGDIGIGVLASRKDIFSIEESGVEAPEFRGALEEALGELQKMRREEGQNLAADIIKRIDLLDGHVADVERQQKEFAMDAGSSLTEKIKNILGNSKIQVDESRIIQEAAFIVERADITEEIVRMNSHLKHTKNVLTGDTEVIGKKMEFFCQELLRELNTIGSKSASAEISAVVVEMKHELEKIREQVQNIQ